MLNRRVRECVLVLLIVGISTCAMAEWSSDASINNSFADRTGDQTIEKIAITASGNTYLGWFDNASGNYNVYLQLLDPLGNELWAHNGILVSDHPQDSWLTDWDMMADSDGNAILVFNDIRAGGDWDIYAYKIAPDGTFLWGPDGLTLSDNPDFEPSPCVTEASDGDLVFVWSRSPDSGSGDLRMQRVSPDGTQLLAAGGVSIVAVAGETPGFPDVVPAADGSVIVSWVRDISSYMSYRHFHGGRFSTTGTAMWLSTVSVFDAFSLPMGYAPKIKSDSNGGAIFFWQRSDYSLFNSFVQILNGAGNEQFPHNGLAVTTESTRHHLDVCLDHNPDTGEIFVFWNERNSAQSQWGIYGQKITVFGGRLWSNTGRMLLPVNSEYKSYPRCGCVGDGAMVFWIDSPTNQYGQDRIVGMYVDGAGNNVWPDTPTVLASTQSTKGRLVVDVQESAGVDQGLVFWEDNRNGTQDIFGQNILADGSLGPGEVAVGSHRYPFACEIGQNSPNPFYYATNITVSTDSELHQARIQVFDVAGKLVRQLAVDDLIASSRTIVWDGHADSGELLPSGVYFYQVTASDGSSELKKAILIK